MANKEKKVHVPLFHIVKRSNAGLRRSILTRVIAVLAALLTSGVLLTLLSGKSPIAVYSSMVSGVFGTADRRWALLQSMSILMCISLALAPAFKMRFWNCGAEGQVFIGGLACVAVMMFCGGKVPQWQLYILMVLASIAAGMLWALLPALFQVKWGTNETLFTLMMNYVAIQLVMWFLKAFVKSGSGTLEPMVDYGLPRLFGQQYLLNIVVVLVLTAVMYVYLKYSKQGYEISVVGESQNTARYIGINVNKVVIRTMLISGAICGLAGLLLTGGTSHTISNDTVGGQGFTAIMVAWLAKFNPLTMLLTTFLIVFLDLGAGQVSTDLRVDNSVSDIVTGIILLFIIGCEFFLRYKLVFRKNGKEAA